MKLCVIGLGLIGGSAALVLRHKQIATQIKGVDTNPVHAAKALELGLVDEILPLEQAVEMADVVIVAIPVNHAPAAVTQVLNLVTHQIVMDMGSTKAGLLQHIEHHANRGRFVAAHPMWGTEFSGPEAATVHAFKGKAAVICNAHQSDEDAVKTVKGILEQMGMHIVEMEAQDHDVHTAYVSHISHITSFALANTVLEKEREEDAIFELASAGFESTVRLAKSNADMWVPILMQNRDNVLDEHISQLRKFKACLEKENWDYLRELIEKANQIKKII